MYCLGLRFGSYIGGILGYIGFRYESKIEDEMEKDDAK